MAWQRWITIVIILGILLLVFALLMPAVEQSREAARRSMSKNNLKQIGLAIHNYNDTFRCLPPGGIIREDETAMQGWIIMIYPFMEASSLYNRVDFDETWKSPNNLTVFETSLIYYLIPGVDIKYTSTGYGLTHYLGNPNVLYRNSCVEFDQMKNGTTHTWMAGEITGNYQPWGYPFNWRPLGTKLCEGLESFGNPVWNGSHLLMADGSVSFFSQETSPEILKRLAEAPPVATEEQTARPSKVFQTGNFHWERIDLQADAKGKTKYLAKVLRSSARTPLVIYLYYAANLTPEELSQQKNQGDTLHYLLQIESTTDIPKALEGTTLFKATTPEQFQANVKTLQALQKQLQ